MQRRPLLLPAVLACLLSAAAPAHAEERASLPEPGEPDAGEPVWQPEIAAHLSGNHGLTGFGSVIDGRIPSPFLALPQTTTPSGAFSSRFTLRYGLERRHLELGGRAATYAQRARRQALRASYGLTVQGFDLAITLPLEETRADLGAYGAPDGRVRARGVGDLLVGGKLGFRIPKFFLQDWAIAAAGPYVLARLPTGADRLERPAEVEYGFAVSGPYGYGFRYTGNLALLQAEGGEVALVVRASFSGVPIAHDACTLRVFFNVNGLKPEGPPTPSVDLEAGVQVLLGGLLTLELNGSFRALDGGYVEPELEARIRRGFGGDTIRRSDDHGRFAFSVGVGILL